MPVQGPLITTVVQMSLLGKHGRCSAARMGTAHPPSCWQNELQDCIINAIRPGSLCTSTADLSALYNKRHFPLWPGFQSIFPPKVVNTDACMEKPTSEFVLACHSEFFQHGTQVKGKRTPSAFDMAMMPILMSMMLALLMMTWMMLMLLMMAWVMLTVPAQYSPPTALVPVWELYEHLQYLILPTTLRKELLIPPFCRWRNWGLEKKSDLLKAQEISGPTRTWTQVCDF